MTESDVFRAHSEVERNHWWFSARRHILRSVVEAVVPAGQGRCVVDLACGVGGTAAAFHPDYHYIGYEPSSRAIDFARATYPGVTFHAGRAAAAAPDLAQADAVLLNNVLEYVDDDRALLRDAVMPMPVNSWLLVTVPAILDVAAAQHVGNGMNANDHRRNHPHGGHNGNGGHEGNGDVASGPFRRYDPASLLDACTGLPLRLAMLSHFNSRLYRPARAVRWLTTRFNRAPGSGNGRLDRAVPPAPVNAALRKLFEGEARSLTATIDDSSSAYSRGVSIIALLQRQAQDTGSTGS